MAHSPPPPIPLSCRLTVSCPSFRVGAAACAPAYPPGWGPGGQLRGDRLLQQQEGEAGSCLTSALQRQGDMDGGEKMLLPLLHPLLSAYTVLALP